MDILPSNTSAAAMDSSPECVFILSWWKYSYHLP
jgi:hypothetical protein